MSVTWSQIILRGCVCARVCVCGVSFYSLISKFEFLLLWQPLADGQHLWVKQRVWSEASNPVKHKLRHWVILLPFGFTFLDLCSQIIWMSNMSALLTLSLDLKDTLLWGWSHLFVLLQLHVFFSRSQTWRRRCPLSALRGWGGLGAFLVVSGSEWWCRKKKKNNPQRSAEVLAPSPVRFSTLFIQSTTVTSQLMTPPLCAAHVSPVSCSSQVSTRQYRPVFTAAPHAAYSLDILTHLIDWGLCVRSNYFTVKLTGFWPKAMQSKCLTSPSSV